ncbi:hypothetical protein D3C78_19440 [compost metagenome]
MQEKRRKQATLCGCIAILFFITILIWNPHGFVGFLALAINTSLIGFTFYLISRSRTYMTGRIAKYSDILRTIPNESKQLCNMLRIIDKMEFSIADRILDVQYETVAKAMKNSHILALSSEYKMTSVVEEKVQDLIALLQLTTESVSSVINQYLIDSQADMEPIFKKFVTDVAAHNSKHKERKHEISNH